MKPIRLPFFVLFVSFVVMLLSSGCGSLLKIERSEATPIPLEPRESPELQEGVRRLAAYGGDVLDHVWAGGATAGNAAVGQAERALAVLEAYLGAPARRLIAEVGPGNSLGPGTLVPNAQFDAALAAAEAALVDARAKEADYQQALDDARAAQMGAPTGTKVGSGWLAWLTGLGWLSVPLVAAATWFLVPNGVLLAFGGALLRLARGLAGRALEAVLMRGTRGLQQLVEGIEGAKPGMDTDSWGVLRGRLMEATDPATRQAIDVLRAALKEQKREAELNGKAA